MNAEELLELIDKNLPAIEAMSEAQLREHFAPYLEYIRPVEVEESNKAPTIRHTPTKKDSALKQSEKAMEMAQRMAKQLGIKI